MQKNILLLTFIISFQLTSHAQTKSIEVEPKGAYRQIDVARHNEAIGRLSGTDKALQQQTVDSVLNNPNYYNPPVLYALSRVLFNDGKKDEAAYWFYVAQLRARYDANLCIDNSARQGVAILNQEYGPEINKYAIPNMDNLEKIVTRVVAFVRTNNENYDHRWLNLHGMDAMMAGLDDKAEKKELSQPRKKWSEIKKKTVHDYYNDFMEYAKKSKKK